VDRTVGAYLFAYNIWRTLDAVARPRTAHFARQPALPVVEG
jgi:hypothetical protein